MKMVHCPSVSKLLHSVQRWGPSWCTNQSPIKSQCTNTFTL